MELIAAVVAFLLGLGWLGLVIIAAIGVIILIALSMITSTIKAFAHKEQKGEWYR
jgi:hypothetical protein